MPTLRRNEWNFASNAAQSITQILRRPEYAASRLGRAEAELSELRSARRLDLVIFGRGERETTALITGELKVPWDALGRNPHHTQIVNDAHGKAANAGALYFITWNIRRLVLWKTDDPGVALFDRVVYDRELIPLDVPLTSESDLRRPDVTRALTEGMEHFLEFAHSLMEGPPRPVFLPLDRIFIARLESALYYPIHSTQRALTARIEERRFKLSVERWMRDEQGWLVTPATQDESLNRAARFTCYVLVNRLCFYNALRRKYGQLPRLTIPNNIITGEGLERKLRDAFDQAKRYTGDYDTVFDGDFGDSLPFLSNDAVGEWRTLVRTLDHYDFANITLDVIGAMYEQLITPEERHRFGQHYTQPSVVDLINAFTLETGRERVLDPGCGGGTFLVRAYARKAVLDPSQDHTRLLEQLYGCDVLNYACHLKTINLAIRDLIDDDNFPRVHAGDFLRFRPGAVFNKQPVRLQAGGLVSHIQEIRLGANEIEAVIGNPPYISAAEMSGQERAFYHRGATTRWPQYAWRRASDINIYFWLHGADFLREEGRMGLLTQAAWLDVDYGIPLQQWMLDNFTIVAIFETEAEPWFTDARVATAVTILRRETEHQRRHHNIIRFVQFRRRLSELVGPATDEHNRQQLYDALRARILEATEDESTDEYRLRLIAQRDLQHEGTAQNGRYVGAKWGRYLRATDTYYQVHSSSRNCFVQLSTLAPVERGITTNCDDFFLVSDITQGALAEYSTSGAFRQQYGVERDDCNAGRISIIRRSDGVEYALETDYLRPILKSARDINVYSTERLRRQDVAVVLPNRRNELSRLARRYVTEGEGEGWHRSPSFEGLPRGTNWYSLREARPAPILFVKTMQYSPVVLLNSANVLANQRLYEVRPSAEVDSEVLCAVLNSSVFACERYSAVKALGREAAIDVEVFSANAFYVPDVRRLTDEQAGWLRTAMRTLCERELGSLLEDPLRDCGFSEARAYTESNAVSQQVWPDELRDTTRQQIDEIVLAILGVPNGEISRRRESIYNELIAYTRRLRLLELEAQQNRRGQGAIGAATPRQLADDIWAHLVAEGFLPRRLPQDFVLGVPTHGFQIPLPGPVHLTHPSLFEPDAPVQGYIGRNQLTFRSSVEAEFISLLAGHGISGDILVPDSAQACASAVEAMRAYLEDFMVRLNTAVSEVTSNERVRTRIVREAVKRLPTLAT